MELVSRLCVSPLPLYCCCLTSVIYQLLEFRKVAFATGVGFLLMGFIGFFVKLVHIPINQVRHSPL